MAIPFTIPPWLSVRPTDFAQANQSGMNSGIAAAHIWAAAAEEQARLQQSARQKDMENALESERLQQKSIYDAQKLATDAAYNKAVLSQAQARAKDVQDKAAQAARQWQENQKRLAQNAATREAQNQQRIDISKGNAADLSKYRSYLENKPPTTSTKLSPDAQVDDDLLRQKIVQVNSQIMATSALPKTPANKKSADDLVSHRDDLVLQRKKLRGYVDPAEQDQATLDEETASLADQAQQDEEERFTVEPKE